jgi:hypothetical protein
MRPRSMGLMAGGATLLAMALTWRLCSFRSGGQVVVEGELSRLAWQRCEEGCKWLSTIQQSPLVFHSYSTVFVLSMSYGNTLSYILQL